ncbi:MAG: DUF4468 domain-containing protein [Prevotella sp.]|uniref:DUF4468 domain-containing protein n=1 Tax=Segatella cerevisiae TaxID=2053716 RepID=A0ABT1BUA4_9BACT|nr:DUF4468 domain-containing protein [Segatella cerevisiae]MCI1246621.1 DUF4468 domain-containing protein [Prevotella sp.]MCO6024668.1 DUF4468 domain-containing protein [Segatella cerevisiae]
MKQAFAIIMLCLPLSMEAKAVEVCKPLLENTEWRSSNDTVRTQDGTNNSDWTIPDQQNNQTSSSSQKSSKKAPEKKPVKQQLPVKLKEDPKYLSGAVPTDKKGKVVFTLDENIPGRSKKEIYDSVYQYLNQLTKGKDELEGSRVALVSNSKGIIAATVREWMVFRNTFISLDRTKFLYTIIAKCSDNHLHMTLSRISYSYEEGRPGGFNAPAEEIISDKYALTKKKNDLARMYGKFRKGTIDRKDEIFKQVTAMFQEKEEQKSE